MARRKKTEKRELSHEDIPRNTRATARRLLGRMARQWWKLLLVAGAALLSSASFTAIPLAVGMGIQNFPEGAAISLPLRQEGMSRGKSFIYGMLSGIVEPIFGVLVVLAAGGIQPLMPWLLSFAAGAMMYVVVEELIPEAHLGEHSNIGTLGVMGGFLLMMVLDVALG